MRRGAAIRKQNSTIIGAVALLLIVFSWSPECHAQSGTLVEPFPTPPPNAALHYQRGLLLLASLDERDTPGRPHKQQLHKDTEIQHTRVTVVFQGNGGVVNPKPQLWSYNHDNSRRKVNEIQPCERQHRMEINRYYCDNISAEECSEDVLCLENQSTDSNLIAHSFFATDHHGTRNHSVR